MIAAVLTAENRKRLVDALDSHIYWDLSEDPYRRNGAVLPPGAEDPEAIAEIAACEALQATIEHESAPLPFTAADRAAYDAYWSDAVRAIRENGLRCMTAGWLLDLLTRTHTVLNELLDVEELRTEVLAVVELLQHEIGASHMGVGADVVLVERSDETGGA